MRKYLTGNQKANEIRMLQAGDKIQRTYILVEGSTDRLLYKNFFNAEICKVISAGGKDKALRALDILEKDDFKYILAIIDADFSRIEERQSASQNLFLTDTHDLETLILSSPALNKVLAEWGSEKKVSEFLDDNPDSIAIFLARTGQVIGYLRWLSLKDQLALKFEGLTFGKFVEKRSLHIDITKFLTTVKNNSQRHDLSNQDILEKLEELQQNNYPLWQICCGHDLVELLSIGLCKLFGSCNSKDVIPDKLEKYLRLAYEYSFFQQTDLFTQLQQWSQEHQLQLFC